MKKMKINKFSLYFLTFFLIVLYFYYQECRHLFLISYLIDYLKDIYSSTQRIYQVQFINESLKDTTCFLSLEEKIYDYDQNKILYITYFPRTARIVFNQFVIFFIVSFVLLKKNKIVQNLKRINLQFLLVLVSGLIISVFSINLTINSFESSYMLYLFIFFSILKCFILFQYLQKNSFHLNLLLLGCFPFISTGFGTTWFFDFLIYYILFSVVDIKKYKKEKMLLIVIFSLALSLIYPAINSPSVEMQISDGMFQLEETSNLNEISKQRNTFLEIEDLELLSQAQIDDQIENEIFNVSRYLKGVQYPDRYMYLISIFPDIQYHIPALIWYLSFVILFFNIFKYLQSEKLNNLALHLEKSAKILIFYQIFSIFLGINTYFNSFSNFLFSLSRNAELITFQINQTWRGIASHYEMFSNLQIISLCFFLVTYFVTRKNIYILFSLISIFTTFLSQSRWNTLLVFLLLFVLMINFYKKFAKQIVILVLFSIFIFQYIPVFEREEPFIIYQDGIEAQFKHDQFYSLGIIEPLTDRLNRTLPWKMFASGYEVNSISLTLGHGPASYLNIVKNSETKITSGPHSSLLLILNKFGMLGIIISLIISYIFIKESYKKLNHKNFIHLILFSLFMVSLDIKTDTLLLTDGVAVFFFNLFTIKLYQKAIIENTSKLI